MSEGNQAPPEPTWETDPIIEGARLLQIGLMFMVNEMPFHVRLDDPAVRVVDGSDGHVRGFIDGDRVVRIWMPRELVEATPNGA